MKTRRSRRIYPWGVITHLVRWLHYHANIAILPAIAVSASVYCLLAIPLAKILPRSEIAFWLSATGVTLVAAIVLKCLPPRDEPQYRSTFPVWIKLPCIVVLVFGLILLKKHLGGFMTIFPMVGVFGAYEARHSLWTMGRQIPIVMLTMTPMMIACHLAQGVLGLPGALGVAWLVFGVAISFFHLLPQKGAQRAVVTKSA